jgi:hypothetical protein
MRRGALLTLVAVSCLSLASSRCRIGKPDDPMLDFDVFEGATWDAAEIVPDAPWIRAGRDREFGTRDDRFEVDVRGDVDLVLRTGRDSIGATIPAPSAAAPLASWPQGVAEPFGAGVPVPYVVVPVDAWEGPAPGRPAAPPYWSGLPLLVFAFADLDGDGFIGVTHLDGDTTDHALEEAEWEPVARRFTSGVNGIANGMLRIGVGGPPSHPVRVALCAAAWAGDFEPTFFGGNVPRGPAVMTRVPFLPEMAPGRVLEGGPQGPPPATPDALVGVEIRPAIPPDPADPRFGEAFTLRLDGSDATIDAALVTAGVATRFGLVQVPDPLQYRAIPERPLRPGLAPNGSLRGVEVLRRLFVADDGSATRVALRAVALDALGNVTEPDVAASIVVRATGPLRIVSPDQDGDPTREIVLVSDAFGTALEIDDTGGAFDGADAGAIVLEAADSNARIEVLLPDPDVDDDGTVTAADVEAIHDGRGARLGEPAYEARLDLDASGRVDGADEDHAEASLGATSSVP